MYTHENYLWGLVAYALGFLCILPALIIATRWAIPWSIPRNVVRLFFAALLLTPARAYTDMYYLAPAWMVAAFEFVRPSSVEGPARAITAIVVSFAVLLLIYATWLLASRFLIQPRFRSVKR